MKKNFLIVFTILFCFSTVSNLWAETFKQIYNFNSPEIKQINLKNKQIKEEGYYSYGVPGYPDLPSKIIRIAIHPNALPDTIKVNNKEGKTINLGTQNISKLPSMQTWNKGKKLIYDNEEIYSTNSYFPENYIEFLGFSQLRKWKIVNLKFTPFQYNPVTKNLRKIDSIEVSISYEKSLSKSGYNKYLNDQVMDERAKGLIINYQEAKKWYKISKKQKSPVCDYVIITTNEIKSKSNKLSDFQQNLYERGYKSRIITEDDFDHLTGQKPNERADKIRKWLQDNYIAIGIKYVLLIGNPDPVNFLEKDDTVGDIPMKMCWPYYDKEEDFTYNTPTDYYYADLTGDWDLNGDSFFGQFLANGDDDNGPGGVDFMNEVYVGRISVYENNISNLDSILTKIIDYHNSLDTQWRLNALLSMSFINKEVDTAYLAEDMTDDFLTANEISTWKLYMQGSVCNNADSTFESDEELLEEKTLNKWLDSKFGLVWLAGHGAPYTMYIGYENEDENCNGGTLIMNEDTMKLDNNHPAFVYKGACLTGFPEFEKNLQYSFLLNGAVSAVGSTRFTWARSGQWTPEAKLFADIMTIGYYYGQNLFSNEMNSGQALFDIKSDIGLNGNNSLGRYWMCLFGFNILGDPSTKFIANRPPFLQTGPVSDIGCTHAKLSAFINTKNNQTSYYFEYGTTPEYSDKTLVNVLAPQTNSVTVTTKIENLMPNQKYYYRVAALYEDRIIYGEEKTFSTNPPIITLLEPEEIFIIKDDSKQIDIGIKNDGCGILEYEISIIDSNINDIEWIKLINNSIGNVNANETMNAALNINAKDIEPGIYSAKISIKHNAKNIASPYEKELIINVILNPLTIEPENFIFEIPQESSGQNKLTIKNNTNTNFNWFISDIYSSITNKFKLSDDSNLKTIKDNNTNAFIYRWRDSYMNNGPLFKYNDISTIGQIVDNLQDDNYAGPFPIGFSFPFYENEFNNFYIGSNGFIGFGPSRNYYKYTNLKIPDQNSPSNMIAWCWDDLIPGKVYYYSDNNTLTIQFNEFKKYRSKGSISAQIILCKDGGILFQYDKLKNNFDNSSNTIGLSNKNGDTGLLISHNNNYIDEKFAVQIEKVTGWLSVSPQSGVINPLSSDEIFVEVSSYGINQGKYNGYFEINIDKINYLLNIPVQMTINENNSKFLSNSDNFIRFVKKDYKVFNDNNIITKSLNNSLNDDNTIDYKQNNPLIVLTQVPDYNQRIQNLKGSVYNVKPDESKIVVYIYLSGWWNKPQSDNCITMIQPDGKWICDITTEPNDHLAEKIAVFLFPNKYDPVITNGAKILPEFLYKNALHFIKFDRKISNLK